MKISFLLVALTLGLAPLARSQDAATEERLNKLSGQIEDLIAAQKAQQKQLAELSRELEAVREQSGKPNNNYASQEDLKRLAESVKEIERKRADDQEKIQAEFAKLEKLLSASPSKKSASPQKDKDSAPAPADKSVPNEKGYEYTIQQGDTLSVIVQAYKEKNIKITVDQILKANPGLNANRLRPGQKIWIPAPTT
jgi:nucleoid-associated protein YgaU